MRSSPSSQPRRLGFLASPPTSLVVLALAAATLILYRPVVNFEFLDYDDNLYVTDNPWVLHGFTWRGMRWAFSFAYGFYHPLTWLSLMLDAQLFGQSPGAFHLTNAWLHVGNVTLVFAAVFALTRWFWESVLVAALFAFHPINVQSVAWVAERKGLLRGGFKNR